MIVSGPSHSSTVVVEVEEDSHLGYWERVARVEAGMTAGMESQAMWGEGGTIGPVVGSWCWREVPLAELIQATQQMYLLEQAQ